MQADNGLLLMIGAITKYFDKRISSRGDSGDTTKHRLQVATAAMLIEMARADFDVHPEEIGQVTQAVQTTFGLSQAETGELIRLAEQEAKQATDYYQFTSLINRGFSQEEKIQVVELMWQVAYADGYMDKYEDHLVRKLANLMHVSHKDFIAAKHRARRSRED
jgi:uncharacterized tellurite resistance protein B-like protein